MLQVKSRLDNEHWVKNLFHEDENLYIGKIFEMIDAAALRAKIAGSSKAKQLPVLDRRFKQDPATSTVTFAKTFGWAAQVLGVQLPELYVRNDVPGRARRRAVDAAGVASPGRRCSPASRRRSSRSSSASTSRTYRGEHYIKNALPDARRADGRHALRGASRSSRRRSPFPPDMAQAVNTTAQRAREVHAAGRSSKACAWSSRTSSTRARRRTSSAGCRRSS